MLSKIALDPETSTPPTLLTLRARSAVPFSLFTWSRSPAANAVIKVCRLNVKRFQIRTLEGTILTMLSRLYLSELPPENVPEATEPLEPDNAMAFDRPSIKTSAV